jgi:hypothetical protein
VRRASIVLWLLSMLAFTVSARAIEVSEAQKEAARERFARGIERMRAGDHASAAAEFSAAYEVAPYPVVLYNLGIAYQKLGKPVEAVTAMEKVLADPGTLSADRVAQAQAVMAVERKRIGTLAIAVTPGGAKIRVDGIDLPEGESRIRVTAGNHFVEAVLRGHAPARREIGVAGEAEVEVALSLEPTDVALAQLWIRSKLPRAEVWLDGARIGETPLRQSVPVLPGEHAVELRRHGYRTARDRIDLGAGATGEVSLEPLEDPDVIAAEGALLALDAESARDLVLTVDGRRHGPYTGPFALAPGFHDVRVERAGFLPATLAVEVVAGTTVTRDVVLDPTPETVADHNRSVALFRGIGWTATALGALTLGGGIGFSVWNEGERSDLDAQLTPLVQPGGRCLRSSADFDAAFCEGLASDLDAGRRGGRTGRRPIGYALIGVGGALVITGVVLLAVGPDADRYAPAVDEDPFADVGFVPWLGSEIIGAGVHGSF